jgi:hypothetical protein
MSETKKEAKAPPANNKSKLEQLGSDLLLGGFVGSIAKVRSKGEERKKKIFFLLTKQISNFFSFSTFVFLSRFRRAWRRLSASSC